MKKYILISFVSISIFLLSFNSCDKLGLEDSTDNISVVSTKPVITLEGSIINSVLLNGSYEDAGSDATAGSNTVSMEIVSGNVDIKTKGFYVVTFRAVNEYDWVTFAYRSVLVHDGNPYVETLSELYKTGSDFLNINSTITKIEEKPGYYEMQNVWPGQEAEFPIYFADKGNNKTFGVVPGVDEVYGRYFGEATLVGNDLVFELVYYPPQTGLRTTKTATWNPKTK